LIAEPPTGQSVLLVEDSPSQAIAYLAYLQEESYSVVHAENGEIALEHVALNVPDVVVLDLGLPGIQGMEVLQAIREQHPSCRVIVITDHSFIDVAVEAMRNGAFDFVAKPFDAKRLKSVVQRAMPLEEKKQIGSESASNSRTGFHGFISTSQGMEDVYRLVENAAPSMATVFLCGESGTGKELCARAIHDESTRSSQPFIAINCAAIPHSLMESEVFGHEKGAFTGADRQREGALAHADGGTLFLDEICDMHLDLQAKLLRIVQTGTFQRVGSNKMLSADVRFICATNKNPLEEVKGGRFREDLYYRLHVIPVALPALRERSSDILPIAMHFLDLFSREEGKSFRAFSPEAAKLFREYHWPGNVRQLMNVLRNIVVLQSADIVHIEMLPPELRSARTVDEADGSIVAGQSIPVPGRYDEHSSCELPIRPMAVVEQETIESAIKHCGGNIVQAAGLLGMSPSTIYRKRLSWESD